MNKMKGFTLIELMIVIAILGILLAIAIPAYQDYTVRTKVSECFNNQAPVKLQISEYYISNGSMPTAAYVAGSRTTEYCDGFTSADVTAAKHDLSLQIKVNESGVGATQSGLTIQGQLHGYGCQQNGDVEWVCSTGTGESANGRFLPASCRGADARPGSCTQPTT